MKKLRLTITLQLDAQDDVQGRQKAQNIIDDLYEEAACLKSAKTKLQEIYPGRPPRRITFNPEIK